MLVGLQGSGKTTSAAKLARHIVKHGRQPLLVAADPYRPAAADQLETLGKSLDMPVHRAPAGTPVVDIARGGIEAAKRTGRDVVIIDTAGRLTIDDALMDEIRAVNAAVKPVETLLVVDAMTGQEAVDRRPGVRRGRARHRPRPDQDRRRRPRRRRALDRRGDRGAGQVPGHRRGTDALEVFHPDRLAGRILGMGDVLTLVERAQETFDEKQADKLAEQLRKRLHPRGHARVRCSR